MDDFQVVRFFARSVTLVADAHTSFDDIKRGSRLDPIPPRVAARRRPDSNRRAHLEPAQAVETARGVLPHLADD